MLHFKSLAVASFLPLVGALVETDSAAQETFPFPARASQLQSGVFWMLENPKNHGESSFALDLKTTRYDDGSKRWRYLKVGGSNSKNEDWLVWNDSLYAIADGEVMNCWRNLPDHPSVGQDLVFPAGRGRLGGGNQLFVDHGDGFVVLYAHFRQGSIPQALCPHNATYLNCPGCDSSGVPPGAQCGDPALDFRAQADIAPGQRPKVKAGQFLGRVGNSGNSGNPHLHIDMRKIGSTTFTSGTPIPFCAWPTVPLRLHGGFVQRLGSDSKILSSTWTPLAGDDLTQGASHQVIYPGPLLRHGDASAGAVGEVAIAGSGDDVVSAVRDGGGNLKLITWNVAGNGAIGRRGEASAGGASAIAIAHPGLSRDVVTALRDESGNLKLIAWDISQAGTVTRRGQASAGGVSRIAMTRVPGGAVGVVTAIRDDGGNLKLIGWERTTAGEIVRKGQASGGAISEVAIAGIVDGRSASQEGSPNRFTGVVTAVRDAAGDLKLIAWQLTPAMEFVRKGDASAGAVSLVSIVPVRISSTREMLVTAVRDASGDLKLIAWEITATGAINRKGSAEAGSVSAIEAVAVRPQTGRRPLDLVTAVRVTGDLKLIGWDVDAAGRIQRQGEVTAGAVGAIAATTVQSGNRDFLVGGFRTGSGDLKLIAWEVNAK